jgi:plastocyanin
MRRPHLFLLCQALVVMLLGSCGGGGAAGPIQPQVEFSGLSISSDSISVAVGEAVQLTVTPKDQDGIAMGGLPAASWASEDSTIAGVVDGVVTGGAVGRTRVLASLTANGTTHADTIIVVVTASAPGAPAHPVTTVGTTFAPATITIAQGDSVTWIFLGAVHNVTFTAAAAPPGGGIPDQVPPTTVSRAFPSAGTYVYDCTRHANMRGTVIVQSGQQQVFTSVQLAPADVSLLSGDTLRLTAAPLDQVGVPIAGLPSASFITSNATVAVVASDGLVTAVSAGVDTITATITSGGTTIAATSLIRVSAPAAGATVTTPNLTFAPGTVTILAGQTVTWQFSGAVHNVTWLPGPVPPLGDVLDQAIGSTVQRSFPTAGVYTYECTRHNNMTGQVIVQSGQAQVYSSVAVTPATATLLVGGTVQLTAVPLDQTGVPMTGLPAPGFSSGDPAIATVNGAGMVTAMGAGTANITVTISSGAVTHSATATMLVSAPVPGGATVTTPNLTFAPPSVTIAAGGTVTWQFSGNTHNVTFTAAQPPGGNIPDQPAGSSQSRTFTSAGSYGYVCTRHSSMSGTVVVTGSTGTPTYTALELTPQAPFVQLNGLVQLTATPLDQTGAAMVGLPGPVFGSSSTAVATVTPTGLVTGRGVGSTTVTVSLTAGGTTHSATSTITVGSQVGAVIATPGVKFNPDDIAIRPGETAVWQVSGTTHNITFETLAPPGGNIPDSPPGSSPSRVFPQVGEYKYFCTIHKDQGMNGRIRVQ